ncbi:MAG: HAD-IA family hydrolase [Muribaculaceae bacterium]|nr:HAD-IA family hydrolase [Muribaculaceae bacterium]
MMRDFTDEITTFLKRHHYKNVTPTTALIDMDGTLYDSMKFHTLAWKHLADELGIEADRDEFYLYEGMTGEATIDLLYMRQFGRHVTPDEAKEFYHKKTEYFKTFPDVDTMPGAKTLIESMKKMSMKRVLVTGSGQSSLISRIERDFPGGFDENLMITSKSVTHGKPHPEPYLKAMQIAGASPRKCIAIENAPLGVKSADRAGTFTIGITTGPIPAEELSQAGAAVVFGSMQELADNFPALILKLFNTSVE